MNNWLRWCVAFAAAMSCAGCGGSPAPAAAPPESQAAPAPSPAATAPPISPSPRPLNVELEIAPTAPPAASTPAPGQAASPTETPFAYLWPEYLPDGMAPSPDESRVARDGELGQGDVGFFIVTFNGDGRKLIVGGGSVEALALSGTIRTVLVGGRGARLVTSGDQRQLILAGTQGTLFVYGAGIEEQELLRVAESLRPIDVRELRERVGQEG